jgi:hypothetical protein
MGDAQHKLGRAYMAACSRSQHHNSCTKCLTWAITQADCGCHVERLEVLGLAGCGCNSSLLGAKDSIDGGGLAYIGVPHEADHKAAGGVLPVCNMKTVNML